MTDPVDPRASGAEPVRSYSSTFDHDENPISEGGAWLNGRADGIDWSDAMVVGGRVKRIEATFDGVCDLPVVGAVTLPAAVLIRPDGYVAWAGDGGADGLRAACAAWFGA